jgi:hypothetical protein
MVASRSRAHILAEVLNAYIPSYMLRFALFFPTSAFKNLRRYTIVTHKLGERLVNSKLEASRRGLEMDNDVYSSLCISRPFPSAIKHLRVQFSSTSRHIPGGERCHDGQRSRCTDCYVSHSRTGDDGTVSPLFTSEHQPNILQANTLALGLHELAKNTDFQEELRAEIYSAIGGDIAYDNMPLLNAFIKVR